MLLRNAARHARPPTEPVEASGCNRSSRRFRRERVMAWRVTADVIPRCLRADEDVHPDLDARIAVDAAQRDAVHLAVVRSAKRRAARAAEAQPPARRGLVARQL